LRRKSLALKVGAVTIGGEAPVSIQSMTNTDTTDLKATLEQIGRLSDAGCELVRLAVPDEKAALALGTIRKYTPLPLIADIHFDFRLALLSIREGADKVRINPGNIGGKEKLLQVAACAAEKGIPLRIGVNSGSISRELRLKYKGATAEALVEDALRSIDFLEKNSFKDIVVSLKATDVPLTIAAYQEISGQIPYPLHLGVTEAGRGIRGAIKSSLAIGHLLLNGIGDTIRVSLTGDPVEEIHVARDILQAAGLRKLGPEIISCPTCARCKIDLETLVKQVETLIEKMKLEYPLKIAIMGCPVNGPGEAREADIGISGAKNFGIIFKEGQVYKKVAPDEIITVLEHEIKELLKKKHFFKS
jgi:(E)-4-hydroxy-3-methylbut-2-enyl-diphosphate synthase